MNYDVSCIIRVAADDEEEALWKVRQMLYQTQYAEALQEKAFGTPMIYAIVDYMVCGVKEAKGGRYIPEPLDGDEQLALFSVKPQ